MFRISSSQLSSGVFQFSCLLGDLFSGHNSSGSRAPMRMARALVSITPPDRSADPFCSGVYGADGSRVCNTFLGNPGFEVISQRRFVVKVEEAYVDSVSLLGPKVKSLIS